MKVIQDKEYGGERPLFAEQDIRLLNVVVHAGESALKKCNNVIAERCLFEGKYPFWHVDNFIISNCKFTEGARAALWYSSNLEMSDTLVEAPKMFREMNKIKLRNVKLPFALETFWHCSNIEINNVEIHNADYLFMHCNNIIIDNYKQWGNYSFQYCKNITIRNATIHSKDAFWNTEDVTIYDCEIIGEYLGWHSKNLKLIRCKISGTQPLCYTKNLIMEDCVLEDDCDLAFEDSEVNATVKGNITSIKNPKTGRIEVDGVGKIILDQNVAQPADCQIIIRSNQ